MDLRDATLMFLAESAAYPAVAEIAQSAYDRLAGGEDIDYRVLNELIGEASGKGVLRTIRRKYGPAGFEAVVGPVLQEIGRRVGRRLDARFGPDRAPARVRTAEPALAQRPRAAAELGRAAASWSHGPARTVPLRAPATAAR